MRKIINFIKQKVDWILIVSGSYMTAYGIFDFNITSGGGIQMNAFEGKTAHAYGYYYSFYTQLTIAFGIVLLVLGILIYKEKKK